MGLGLYFSEGEGPKFERPLRDEAAIKALRVPDIGKDLKYVTDAVSQIRKTLDGRVPLIGFSGSPWTLSCYMVEGGSSSDYARVKTLMYKEPKLMHHILSVTAESVTQYLNAQIEAGAQAVMIFDSWGGALSHAAYHEFSLPYIQQIVDGLIKEKDGVRIPSVVFTKGGGLWIESIANTGCDAVGLDWTMDIGVARQKVGDKVALQGNLDPTVLFSTPDVIESEVEKILSSYGFGSGHVFNLGHGISQFTNPDNAAALVKAVHELSRKYH
jgi:uroporphyrinogen decarboxylase